MIAIPQPRLWSPRLGPWWRLPRFDSLLMSHLKKGAGGHLLKNAAGHLVKDCGSGSNCNCEIAECSNNPISATVTLSMSSWGSTFCGLFGGIYGSQTQINLSGLNGDWTVDCFPTYGYSSTFSGTVPWTRYAGPGCTGAVTASGTASFTASIQLFSGLGGCADTAYFVNISIYDSAMFGSAVDVFYQVKCRTGTNCALAAEIFDANEYSYLGSLFDATLSFTSDFPCT